MASIHLLPDPLISQIAAGEVVERPASVVKELIENALDAGATTVSVDLAAGGKQLVRVADDGGGMGRDDALLAFDRHATSKIASFADLERIGTLGFRGEALASIAAVSRVELITAERPGDGTRVRIEGGRIFAAEPVPHPQGTAIEVAALFFNVPARRKFLKAPSTELRRCLEVVEGYALARPGVRFVVQHEGREVLVATPAGDGEEGLRGRIAQLFGAAFAAQLIGVPQPSVREPSASPRDNRDAAVIPSIWGFLGRPGASRSRRSFLFVNRRLVRDRALFATFYRAVREEWRSDEFPPLFLFLDLPPEEVDVNVHPQKSEVRFRGSGLLGLVGERLRGALAAARGEEAAPSRPAVGRPSGPLAWGGLGAREEASARRWQDWPREIREPLYAPLDRPVVPLSGRSGEAQPFRLLGQYKGTLILLAGPDGLYLIDQHVAHERILYERLRRSLSQERAASQHLLEPRLLALSTAEGLRLLELAGELEACGFELHELSGGTLAVTSAPAALGAGEAEGLLLALAREPEEGGMSLRERLLSALAASLACRAAVKMHEPLPAPQLEALVQELFAAEQPYACPHGRPIVLVMTDADLERRFGRR